MKLAAKLIAVTILAVLAVFAGRGYQNARRQMALSEADARENAWLVGRALRPALVDVWRKEGEQRALEVFSYARERVSPGQSVGSALHPALQPGPSGQRAVGPAHAVGKGLAGRRGHAGRASFRDRAPRHLLPVQIEDHPLGALEVSGPLTVRDERFKTEMIQIVQRTALEH